MGPFSTFLCAIPLILLSTFVDLLISSSTGVAFVFFLSGGSLSLFYQPFCISGVILMSDMCDWKGFAFLLHFLSIWLFLSVPEHSSGWAYYCILVTYFCEAVFVLFRTMIAYRFFLFFLVGYAVPYYSPHNIGLWKLMAIFMCKRT